MWKRSPDLGISQLYSTEKVVTPSSNNQEVPEANQEQDKDKSWKRSPQIMPNSTQSN